MERYDIMKTDDIMEKLYVELDIHQETLTKTAMNKEGKIEFCGTIPNTKEAVQCFSSVIPSPQVKIAVEACDLWRGVYKMLTEFGYHVVLANSVKTHQIVAAKKTDKGDSKTFYQFDNDFIKRFIYFDTVVRLIMHKLTSVVQLRNEGDLDASA